MIHMEGITKIINFGCAWPSFIVLMYYFFEVRSVKLSIGNDKQRQIYRNVKFPDPWAVVLVLIPSHNGKMHFLKKECFSHILCIDLQE